METLNMNEFTKKDLGTSVQFACIEIERQILRKDINAVVCGGDHWFDVEERLVAGEDWDAIVESIVAGYELEVQG